MKELKVKDIETNGYNFMLEGEDFEYVNPIQKMSEIVIQMIFKVRLNYLMLAKENNLSPNLEGLNDANTVLKIIAMRNAIEIRDKSFQEIMLQKLPAQIFNILENSKKKEQLKLLKGLSLTEDELSLFIFQAWTNFGFKYSMYTSRHNHKGLNENEMPLFAHKDDDGEVKVIGETELSQGQIKNAIDYRTVIISRFLDKGEKWHCFFLTFQSLNGKEIYKDGQPHLHFISHTWGLSRDYVLEQLRSKDYKLPSLPHIDFHTHRNPRDTQP
jgi:hypothetical protein